MISIFWYHCATLEQLYSRQGLGSCVLSFIKNKFSVELAENKWQLDLSCWKIDDKEFKKGFFSYIFSKESSGNFQLGLILII